MLLETPTRNRMKEIGVCGAPVGLHVSLGPSAAANVGEAKWQFSTADRFFVGTAEGIALERKCLGDFYTGAQWSPVENGCADVQSNLTVTLYELAKGNITKDKILDSTLSMAMMMTAAEDLSPSDVQYVAQILRNAASVPAVEPEVLRSVVHTVDTVINTISASENRDIFSNLPRKIGTAVENIALNTQTDNKAVKVAGNNIALSVLPLSLIPRGGVLENWGSDVTMLLNDSDKEPEERLEQFESFEVAVFLPENVLEEKRRNKETDMVIVVSRNSQFLKNVTVISAVIDVVMGTEQVFDVDPPLKMIFKVLKVILFDTVFVYLISMKLVLM
ncbi:hypothetical protein AVEN_167477-1 [Araneus ventricosus]|uniref:Uncharacterized protein n=1 Tax=Araneus ventricosus TaxID=182803 RepID=A0A4Y2ID58_ARAVE|nr:hypothetical protein AVEN_167477-1 [Araneus ventricosus]